ncbi:hypothetical protein R3P38DRAFT_3081738 [Favolaschia claudopus]|uniref:Uncharacterized protein n=1 Tax=Favolaschia claudopus TaxID=2862362 RepID=A0AAV9ZV63_9AGAR
MDHLGSTFDLLKNRDPAAVLGAFDSQVAAILHFNGQPYFITTNTDYIPRLPIRKNHSISLRQDLRYGDDDPTQWPQQYSARYCHLGAIPTTIDHRLPLSALFWSPCKRDFVEHTAAVRGLGTLAPFPWTKLERAVKSLLEEYEEYVKQLESNSLQPLALFPSLAQQISLTLERLQCLPSPYTKMVLTIRELQRFSLEFVALLRYMKIYKPRIEKGGLPPLKPDACIGAFVADATLAQNFHAAGIPYWYMRPTSTFRDENILAVVEPLDPSTRLELDAEPEVPAIPTGTFIDAKIEAMREVARRSNAWYRDPFNDQPPPTEGTSQASEATSSRTREPKPEQSRHHPYASKQRASTGSTSSRGGPGTPAPKETGGRNKFEVYTAEEMPPSIPAWAEALKRVDRSRPVEVTRAMDGRYVFPEPALLVSQQDSQRRQLSLHHWTLLREPLFYRMADADDPHTLLTTQQWRDVLFGKVRPGGRGKGQQRCDVIDEVLGPAMRAFGLSQYSDFPANASDIIPITIHRAREIVWDVAESNFRYEFLALDRRASGLVRHDQCCTCFAGGTLMNIPLNMGKCGLASESLDERHRYICRIARLMRDWVHKPPSLVIDANLLTYYSDDQKHALESAVAVHYTQTFYALFGRAAVIPMRL